MNRLAVNDTASLCVPEMECKILGAMILKRELDVALLSSINVKKSAA
jgi:hypothetical protein